MAIVETTRRSWSTGRRPGSLRLPLVVSLALALLAVGYVAFVLWARWPRSDAPHAPALALPSPVAAEFSTGPPGATPQPLQRRPGPQERLDLAFLWPSLAPPDEAA